MIPSITGVALSWNKICQGVAESKYIESEKQKDNNMFFTVKKGIKYF